MAQKFLNGLHSFDGSHSSPSYSFIDRTDTGMYARAHSDNDRISFTVDGTERFYIDSNGVTTGGNMYASGFRNYSGVWAGTTGTVDNGFYFLNTADGNTTKAMELTSGGNVTFNGSGTFNTVLTINAPDGGSLPAMTSIINMHGYGGRGVGIKMKDNVNTSSGNTNQEWFVGTGYSQSGFNIGYASDGAQSSYAAQNKFSISTSGTSTFTGNVKIQKNTPVLELGISNSSTGNAKLTFFSKNNDTANAYSLLFNKDTSIDRLEFIDGSGTANIKFMNGGSAEFASDVQVGGNTNSLGYVQSHGVLYLRSHVQVMNKAADGFLTLASRDTSGSEVVYNISNVGTLTAAGKISGGEIEGTSLDINGTGDISGVLTLSKSNSSLIATSNTTDAFGYNATAGKGHYIRGTASTYVYGGGKFYDGTTTHTLLHDGSTISTSQITNLSGTNTGDQDLSSYLTASSLTPYYTKTQSNAKFLTKDGSDKQWVFEVDDEVNLSGNRWYKVATVNQGNGGLHMRGFLSNHVEGFGSQKFDLAIQGRETQYAIEITGTVDILHNASGAAATDKCGVRVIKSDTTTSASYHYFDVYIRTTRYQHVMVHLTKTGNTTLHTTAGSNPVTSEPAPVSGGNVEIDTSTLQEGNYVVDDSTPREIYHEGHKPTFAEIETTPTTLAGYGITDAAPITVVNQSDFVSKANGGTFDGNINIHTGASTGTLSVGRNSQENTAINVTDTVNSITANNDSDDDGDHSFILNRVFAGTGASDFKIQNGGTSQLIINKDGLVTIPGDLVINGSTTTLNTATVEVKDNILQLNTTQGSPNTMTASTSGISVFRGLDSEGNDTITQASLIFDEGDDTWDLTNNLKVAGSLTLGASLYVPEFIYHIDDTGTNIQMTDGKLIIKNSGGKYINLHDNGINYHQATYHQFYNKIVCDNEVVSDKGFITHNQRGVSTNPHTVEEYPLGHYTGGKEIWSLDPTWSDSQLKQYFNSPNVEWFEDSTAPAGYSIKISGGVNTGGYYASGFPYIPIEDGSIYLIEVYIRNTSGSVISHYMGTQDFDHAFESPASGGGNPGSYGYHLMSNHDPGTDWEYQYAFVSGNHNSDYGKFETGAKYFTPHSLFNYGHTSGTRECYISGWKVTRIAEQEFFGLGTAAKPAIVFHDGVYSSLPNSGLYREWYDGATATKDQISVSTDGNRRLRINEAGVWTDQNFYVGGDWRTFSSTWDASAGASGAGFRFHNTHADTNSVVALTVSAIGDAVFAGEVEASSLDINGTSDLGGNTSISGTLEVTGDGDFGGGGAANCRLSARGSTDDNTAYALEAANSSGSSLFIVRNDGLATFSGTISSGDITSSGNIQHTGLTMTSGTDVDQIYEPTGMTFELSANIWTDTGIESDDMPTGTYVMQVYVSDFNCGGNHYYESYSATISWYGGTTNSTMYDEIPVHRSGHAPNSGDVQFRTLRSTSGGANLKLQVKHNKSYSSALDDSDGGKMMRFKFRRLI